MIRFDSMVFDSFRGMKVKRQRLRNCDLRGAIGGAIGGAVSGAIGGAIGWAISGAHSEKSQVHSEKFFESRALSKRYWNRSFGTERISLKERYIYIDRFLVVLVHVVYQSVLCCSCCSCSKTFVEKDH